MFTPRVSGLAVMSIAFTVSTGAYGQAADPEAATVTSVAVQTVGQENYFRVEVRWSPNGVPAGYDEFLKTAGYGMLERGHRWYWPVDAVALIPQSDAVFCVARVMGTLDGVTGSDIRLADMSPRSPVVFLGKLRKLGNQAFLFRRPVVDGTWRIVPLSIDFDKATEGKDLAEEWLRAQAGYMGCVSAPADQSFFRFARERFISRLARPGEPVPQSSSAFSGSRFESDRMYEVTTGALAMQESLQLDRMRNINADSGVRDTSVDQLQGVMVPSHPWEQMIGTKTPEIEAIAALVPEDQYYVRFKTTRALADFLDYADAWGGSVLSEVDVAGRDYKVKERIEAQICLRSSWLSKLLGPAVIESLAITGADPYLREGCDVTVIFHLRTPALFEAAVNRYVDEAKAKHADLKAGREQYQGVDIETYTTPDCAVRCHRARVGEFYIYSNSPAGIRRTIDTQLGKRTSLAKSLDFVYIRTMYPVADKKEDGFVFLSDAFIRALTGPRLRIAEKRRVEAVTSMEMIKNAALLYLWEKPGSAVPALEKLYQGGFLDSKHVYTEPGDRIEWDPATFTARSERYGRMGFLTPNVELDVTKVTTKEKEDYERFRQSYQNYWRRYFDPIGIRITAGREMSLSVTILPLINDSQYNELRTHIGGKTIPLEPLHPGRPAILGFTAHANPKSWLVEMVEGMAKTQSMEDTSGDLIGGRGWIGERIDFWIEDSDALAETMKGDSDAAVFTIPMVLALEIIDPAGPAAFLERFLTESRVDSAPVLEGDLTEPYKGLRFTRIRPIPGRSGRLIPDVKEADRDKVALYYGMIGRFLYISTSLSVLHGLVDALPTNRSASEPSQPADSPARQPASRPAGEPGHLALRFDVEQARKSRDALFAILAGHAWEAEEGHLTNMWLLAHTVGIGPKAAVSAERALGFNIESSLGNTYTYDAARDEVVGSNTGSLWSRKKLDGLPADSPLNRLLTGIRRIEARLAFTREGLKSELTVERVGP